VLKYFLNARVGFEGNSLHIFSTYFPNETEIRFLHTSGIKNIYFFGDVTDPGTVKYLKSHDEVCDRMKNEEQKFNIVKLF